MDASLLLVFTIAQVINSSIEKILLSSEEKARSNKTDPRTLSGVRSFLNRI